MMESDSDDGACCYSPAKIQLIAYDQIRPVQGIHSGVGSVSSNCMFAADTGNHAIREIYSTPIPRDKFSDPRQKYHYWTVDPNNGNGA